MAVTSTTTTMMAGVTYTSITDSSADWSSVANSTYFYDKTDKLVYYKDASGNILSIFTSGATTDYGVIFSQTTFTYLT